MIPKVISIAPKSIPYMWHQVKPLIDKALVHSNGELTSDDVLELLLSKRETLVIGYTDPEDSYKEILMAAVTEVVQYPRKKVLRIIAWATKSGYDGDEWLTLFSTIEYIGKKSGCDYIEAWTRKGMARKMKWDHEYSVITKQL